jgi:hypothetical protein
MSCQIKTFDVVVQRHPRPDDAAGHPEWLIRIHVLFESDDPKDWGELRASGAHC